jgi:hypothetical protein
MYGGSKRLGKEVERKRKDKIKKREDLLVFSYIILSFETVISRY